MCNGDDVTANSLSFFQFLLNYTLWVVGPLNEITTLLFGSFGWLVMPSRSMILLAFAHDPRRHSGRLASSKHPIVQLPSEVLEVPGPWFSWSNTNAAVDTCFTVGSTFARCACLSQGVIVDQMCKGISRYLKWSANTNKPFLRTARCLSLLTSSTTSSTSSTDSCKAREL